jgi:hypothetical protein
VQDRLNELGAEGTTDPFDSIYKIVYQLTMRAIGATELSNDRKLLDKTLGLFETVEQSTTPTLILFPWFPSLAFFKRLIAGTRLYFVFDNIVNNRKKTGKRYDDALQYLMDQGDRVRDIITVSASRVSLNQPLFVQETHSLSL